MTMKKISQNDRPFCISSNYLLPLTIFFSQHYLDLDMSQYEGHLYSNVEELEASTGLAHSLETRGPYGKMVTMPTEQQDSKL